MKAHHLPQNENFSKQQTQKPKHITRNFITIFSLMILLNMTTGCQIFSNIFSDPGRDVQSKIREYDEAIQNASTPAERAYIACNYHIMRPDNINVGIAEEINKFQQRYGKECSDLVSGATKEILSQRDSTISFIKAKECYDQSFDNIDRARDCRNHSRNNNIKNIEDWDTFLRGTSTIQAYARKLNAMEKYLPNLKSSATQRINEVIDKYGYPDPLSDKEAQQLNKCYLDAKKSQSSFVLSEFAKNHDKKICKNGQYDKNCTYVTILKSTGEVMPGNVPTDYIYKGYLHVSELVQLQNAVARRGNIFPKGCANVINKKAIYDEASPRISSLNKQILNYDNDLEQLKSQYTSAIATYCNNITSNTIEDIKSTYSTTTTINNYKIISNGYVPNDLVDRKLKSEEEYLESDFYKQITSILYDFDMTLELCKNPDKRTSVASLTSEPFASDYIRETYPKASRHIFFNEEEYNKIIEANKYKISNCMLNSIIKGNIAIKFTVNPTGLVSEINVLTKEFVGTPVEQCVIDVINNLKFKSFVGNSVTFTENFE